MENAIGPEGPPVNSQASAPGNREKDLHDVALSGCLSFAIITAINFCLQVSTLHGIAACAGVTIMTARWATKTRYSSE